MSTFSGTTTATSASASTVSGNNESVANSQFRHVTNDYRRQRKWSKWWWPWRKSETEVTIIWLYTFLSYAFLTACRQCLPVAKPFMMGTVDETDGVQRTVGGFAPFNDPKFGSTYLGILDSAFVLTYTICSFIWAHKKFAPLQAQIKILTLALLGSFFSVVLFGLGGLTGIHKFWYYVLVQLLMGFMQSGAWSAVLNVYYAVFDISEGIYVFSMWASCSAIGNILGRNIASPVGTQYGWPTSFICVGFFVFALGLTYPSVCQTILTVSARKEGIRQLQKQIHLEEERRRSAMENSDKMDLKAVVKPQLFPKQPPKSFANRVLPTTDSQQIQQGNETSRYDLASDVDEDENEDNGMEMSNKVSTAPNATASESNVQESVAGSGEANSMMILFIFLYSIGLMFSKWMNYLMSLWLPVYLTERAKLTEGAAGAWSSAFDVGAVFGMFFAFISNFYYKRPGCLCFIMCAISIPVLLVYSMVVTFMPLLGNAATLFVLGMLFNGPYSLISTVVTMQLSEQFGANANAIISIVNGSGSAGSLCAGVFTAMIADAYGWNAVFYMLIGLATVQLVPLGYITYTEVFPKAQDGMGPAHGANGGNPVAPGIANRVKPSFSFSEFENDELVLPTHNAEGAISPDCVISADPPSVVKPSPFQSYKFPTMGTTRNRGNSNASSKSGIAAAPSSDSGHLNNAGMARFTNNRYMDVDVDVEIPKWTDVKVKSTSSNSLRHNSNASMENAENEGPNLFQNNYMEGVEEGYARLDDEGYSNAVRDYED
jgi:sugar phosphate permease